jgi:hypothetical protein
MAHQKDGYKFPHWNLRMYASPEFAAMIWMCLKFSPNATVFRVGSC